jgi:hypothetical protein
VSSAGSVARTACWPSGSPPSAWAATLWETQGFRRAVDRAWRQKTDALLTDVCSSTPRPCQSPVAIAAPFRSPKTPP